MEVTGYILICWLAAFMQCRSSPKQHQLKLQRTQLLSNVARLAPKCGFGRSFYAGRTLFMQMALAHWVVASEVDLFMKQMLQASWGLGHICSTGIMPSQHFCHSPLAPCLSMACRCSNLLGGINRVLLACSDIIRQIEKQFQSRSGRCLPVSNTA